MKSIKISLCVFTMVFSSWICAHSNWVLFHPAQCEAINPVQSLEMEWRPKDGLVNRGSRVLWVLCPLPGEVLMNHDEVLDPEKHDQLVILEVGNDSNSTIDVDCVLRSNFGGWQAKSESLAIRSGEWDQVTFAVEDRLLNAASIACRLPPGGAVGAGTVITTW